MSYLRLSLTSVLLSGLGACATAPEPTFYTLDVTAPSTTVANTGTIIGLAEISLPAYARNLQITTAISPHQIAEDDDHRWANPPSEAISTHLRQILHRQTGAYIVPRPFPTGIRPNVRLSVSFDTLLRTSDGGAALSGQFILTQKDSTPIITGFAYRMPAESTDYTAYMSALSDGLNALGVQIAAAESDTR